MADTEEEILSIITKKERVEACKSLIREKYKRLVRFMTVSLNNHWIPTNITFDLALYPISDTDPGMVLNVSDRIRYQFDVRMVGFYNYLVLSSEEDSQKVYAEFERFIDSLPGPIIILEKLIKDRDAHRLLIPKEESGWYTEKPPMPSRLTVRLKDQRIVPEVCYTHMTMYPVRDYGPKATFVYYDTSKGMMQEIPNDQIESWVLADTTIEDFSYLLEN